MTNIAKHSQAENVTIQFGVEDNQQRLRIGDDGVGFDTESCTSGLGLIGIKERVKMLGGTISIESATNRGASVTIGIARKAKE